MGLPSPVVGRAGAGGHPCQGIYHRPAGTSPRRVHRDPLQRRLLRALPRRATGRARLRVPRLEHPLPRRTRRTSCSTTRWPRSASACAGCASSRGRAGRPARQLRRRVADGAPTSRRPSSRTSAAAGLTPARRDRELPRATSSSSLAAHPGRPEVLTAWLDPSVIDETDPTVGGPGARPVRPGNGPPYDAEFVAPLPGRPARPQRPHHRLGLGRAGRPGRGRARDRLFTSPAAGPTCA